MRTVNIHALGPSGSGKTVFMAALYNRLRLRRPDLTFYLKTDHEASLALNALYNKIASPAESWPEASQAVNEWHFEATMPTPTGDFEPLEFVYLDYPGGALTNPRAMDDPGIQSLVDRLRSANALLVLLDGQAMLSLMRGERPGKRYLEFDIISSLEIAQQSRCPVHFAITKWDLLEGKHSLADVRFKLMEDENFANLIEAKSQDMPGTIRLIPVSAVGVGFAELLPNGEMKKIGDRPRPHQVELPLVAVLPDFFQFAYAELSKRQEDVAELKKAVELQRSFNAQNEGRMKAIMKAVLEKVMPSLHVMLAQRSPGLATVLALGGDWSIDEIVEHAHRYAKQGAEWIDRERAKRASQDLMADRQKVASDRDALQLLERQAQALITDFEIDHPESVLAGGVREFEANPAWEAALQSGVPTPTSGVPAPGASTPGAAMTAAADLHSRILGAPFGPSLPAGYAVDGLADDPAAVAALAGAGVKAAVEARISAPAGEVATLSFLMFDDVQKAATLVDTLQAEFERNATVSDVFAPVGFDASAVCISYASPAGSTGMPEGQTSCAVPVDRTVVIAKSALRADVTRGNEAIAQALARAGVDHVNGVIGVRPQTEVPA